MLNRFLSIIVSIVIAQFVVVHSVFADVSQVVNDMQEDHVQLVTQQLKLLKDRLTQAQNQLKALQNRHSLQTLADHITNQQLKEIDLDIAVAKSNLDSVNIEYAESQQTIVRTQKHIQDLDNQLNILNIFGLKIARTTATPDIDAVQIELAYQKRILEMESNRQAYLEQLSTTDDKILQLHRDKYKHLDQMLKAKAISQMKEDQEKSELTFQRQQTYWLQQLNELYSHLTAVESSKHDNKSAVEKLEDQIFFANENLNFIYLRTLVARYQDQLQQFKISVAHGTSITALNKIDDQTQLLNKQVVRVNELLNTRLSILKNRKTLLVQASSSSLPGLAAMELKYKDALSDASALNTAVIAERQALSRMLQQQLSSRQVLPGADINAWLSVGEQFLWVPTLAYEVTKNLIHTSYTALDLMSWQWMVIVILCELLWVGLCIFAYRGFSKMLSGFVNHNSEHPINMKWFLATIFQRCFIEIATIINMYGFFSLIDVPSQNFMFLIYLGFVWLFFKAVSVGARLILVESVHDDSSAGVKLYGHIKWILSLGAVVTALSVFLSQLPVVYEIKDLFDRLFLLYVLVISVFLLKSWKTIPTLIMPYIDDRLVYLHRVVKILGLFVPIILLTNSIMGVFGYVNLVLTAAWYESLFLLVSVGYLIVRGILVELMEFISYLVIRHVTNGWLWTEAFLKPIDRILRVIVFLAAWANLFILYGWDEQSPVVERMNKLLSYNLISVLNTTITPLSIIEVLVVVSFLFWAARWTREFVYRFLMSRTKDMGLRNSVAILSQYTTIFIGILFCLRVLGIDFKALTVVAGAFFFAIGLGLKDLINNFACGFLLLIERPIRVGDTVTINGAEGDVLHIGSRAVTIKTFDNKELLVPNSDVFNKTFINWTGRDSVVRTSIPITVNRTDNPREVQKMIHEVLAAHKDVMKEPAPEVFISLLTDSIEFEVRYHVNIRQIKSRLGVKSELLRDIWDMFEKHNIQPPYPHHEVVVLNQT